MYNYQLGGNSGNVALTGGYRKKLYHKKYTFKTISQKELLLSRIAAFFEKKTRIVSYNRNGSMINLTNFCTPIEYQYIYATCAVFSIVGSIEFMFKRWSLFEKSCKIYYDAFMEEIISKNKINTKLNRVVDSVDLTDSDNEIILSKLFAYRLAEDTLQSYGPFIPFSLEAVIEAIQKYGTCNEKYWPYAPTLLNPGLFYLDPSPYCYEEAKINSSTSLRVLELYEEGDELEAQSEKINTGIPELENIINLDNFSINPKKGDFSKIVSNIRTSLYNYHLPVTIGFYLYPSTFNSFLTSFTGFMPYPKLGDLAQDGHCVVIIGYDDEIEVPSIVPGQSVSKGAFLFKNSWSTDWGNYGYGWLAYDYFNDIKNDNGSMSSPIVDNCWSVFAPYNSHMNENIEVFENLVESIFKV